MCKKFWEKRLTDLLGFIYFSLLNDKKVEEILAVTVNDLEGILSQKSDYTPISKNYNKYFLNKRKEGENDV